ncbi:MAG: TatD family hydrolase [Deltaproteobacteria bacterium]|nr:TatD family hydrolase [Deltaproteobacteria bacterium]
MKLIDTHAHLDEVPDLEGALKRAQDAGVLAIVGVGTDLASNEKILQLADRFPNFVLPAVGLHPWRLDGVDLEANARFIEKELSRCVALGEVGLDFAVKTPREKQEEVLQRLLSLAFRARKPVLLHARRAWEEAFQLLQSFPLERAIFHWYSGPLDVLRRVFEQGYFISATPAAAYSERHRAAIQAAPLTHLVLETDAPEMYRGVPSEPADLRKTLQSVSEVKGMKAEEVARHTYRNASEIFQLTQP